MSLGQLSTLCSISRPRSWWQPGSLKVPAAIRRGISVSASPCSNFAPHSDVPWMHYDQQSADGRHAGPTDCLTLWGLLCWKDAEWWWVHVYKKFGKVKNRNFHNLMSIYHRETKFTSKYMFLRTTNTIRLLKNCLFINKGLKYKMAFNYG